MNELKTFQFNQNQLRTVSLNGDPWFVAKDVCDVLGLGDTSKTLTRLDEDEKGTNSIPTLGGSQSMSIVNESGLYS